MDSELALEYVENSLSGTIAAYDEEIKALRQCDAEETRQVSLWTSQLQLFNCLLEPAKRNLKTREKLRVLDLGCGPGLYAEQFMRHGLKYTGVDRSKGSLYLAREFNKGLKKYYGSGPQFNNMDIRMMEFGDDSFDGAWAVLSLNHLEPELTNYLDQGLIEMNRVLKRSAYGFIVIEEGEMGVGYSPKPGFGTFYLNSFESFSEKLVDAGFEIIDCTRTERLRRVVGDVMVNGCLEYFVRKNM